MKFTRWLLNIIGRRGCYTLMFFPVSIYFLLSFKARRNISSIHQSVSDKVKPTAFSSYKNFWNFACTIVDRLTCTKAEVTLSDECDVNFLHPGSIYIGAHFGEWLIAPREIVKREKKKIGILIDTTITPEITKLFDNMTESGLITLISTKENHPIDLALKLKAVVDDGGTLCLVCDRKLAGTPTVEVPFLDGQFSVSLSPFKLIKYLKCPIFFFTSTKIGMGHDCKYLFKNKLLADNSGDLSEKELITKYISALECEVRKKPDHWFNFNWR